MEYIAASSTNVGISKKTNQDSSLVEIAELKGEKYVLGVMCDGMGGLAKGEVASRHVIDAFDRWFSSDFVRLIREGFTPARLQTSWLALVRKCNEEIVAYSAKMDGVNMGTTCSALLIVGSSYYILNVGDSRIYLLDSNLYQLTHDQSFVQREIDAGRMTPEQAAASEYSSVLLQCIGVNDYVSPDFYTGEVHPGQTFLLCCDGFRHVITPAEIHAYLNPKTVNSVEEMQENLDYLVNLNMRRNERDNISASLIKVM